MSKFTVFLLNNLIFVTRITDFWYNFVLKLKQCPAKEDVIRFW